MAEKKLLTRIIMNHDEWASYAGKIAKDGEVIYVKVGTTQANGKVSEPIWMQKIGDGVTEVQNLPWVVAPAADVYEWAKKASLDAGDLPAIPGDKLGLTVTVAGNGNAITEASWDATTKTLTLTKGEIFATKKEFDEHKHTVADITDYESDFATKIAPINTEIAKKADKVTSAIEGNFAGLDEDGNLTDSGKKAADFADAVHTHTKAQITDFAHEHTSDDITDFETEVKSIVGGMGVAGDEEVADLTERMEVAETAIETTLPSLINAKVAQSDYDTKVEALVKADSDLDTAVKAAQKAADDAQADIDAFFSAAETGEAAIDTLKEIQDFLNSGDDTVKTLLDDVADLKAADITLQGNIYKKANQTTVDGIADRLEVVEGRFNDEGKALEAVNADTVDGKHAIDFATAAQGRKADNSVQYGVSGLDVCIPGALDAGQVSSGQVLLDGDSDKIEIGYTTAENDGVEITRTDLHFAHTSGDAHYGRSGFSLDKGGISNFAIIAESTEGNLLVSGSNDVKASFNEWLGTKILQEELEQIGAASKTITKVNQYANGNIEVKFNDIAITASQVTDLDVGVTKVKTTANNGLKVTPAEGTGEVTIDIDDTIVFILDGGNASNLD